MPERPTQPVQAVAARLLKVLARTVPYRGFGAALGVAGDVTGSTDE
jgi:hypothetical protein